jgi:hypothetical protein
MERSNVSGMSGRSSGFVYCRQLVFTSERVNADIYQELLRQDVVPLAEEHILMENTSFVRFSAGLHHKNHPPAFGGIPVSGGFSAIFAGLEPARLCYLARFAGKNPG